MASTSEMKRGNKQKVKAKEEVNPKNTDRPLGPTKWPIPAFIFYSKEQYEALRRENVKIDTTVRKDIAEKWKKMIDSDKEEYVTLARKSSEEYAKSKSLICVKPQPGRTQTRIELKSIVGIIQKLSPLQRLAVEDIGFGGLLGLRCTHLDHKLCDWLVQSFDPMSRSLHVHGRQIFLRTLDVSTLIGLPCNGLQVQLKGSSEGFDNLCKDLGVVDRVIPLKSLKTYLIEVKAEDAGTEFKRKFALYILGALLCPTTKPAIHQSFVHAVTNVDFMKQFNWAKLTLDFLVEGVIKTKAKGQREPTGCLFLLMLFYLDRIAPTGELEASSKVIPRLYYWGDKEIRARLNWLQNQGGYANNAVVVRVDDEDSGEQRLSLALQPHEGKGDTKVASEAPKKNIDQAAFGGSEYSKLQGQVSYIQDSVRQLVCILGSQSLTPDATKLVEEIQRGGLSVGEHGTRKDQSTGEDDEPAKKVVKQIDDIHHLLQRFMPCVEVYSKPLPNNGNDKEAGAEKVDDILGDMKFPDVRGGKVDNFVSVRDEEVAKPRMSPVEDANIVSLHSEKESSLPPPRYIESTHKKNLRLRKKASTSSEVQSPRQTRSTAPRHLEGVGHKRAQFVDLGHSSSSSAPRPRTRLSTERKQSWILNSPYLAEIPKKIKFEEGVPKKKIKLQKNVEEALKPIPVVFTQMVGEMDDPPAFPEGKTTSQLEYIFEQTVTEEAITEYTFDTTLPGSEIIVRMLLFEQFAVAHATRDELSSLKPEAWIEDSVINLVVVQLTNVQRQKYPDTSHQIWYFPTYLAQVILHNPEATVNVKDLAKQYFGTQKYTGPLHTCKQIYIPFNNAASHWLCVKIDMEEHQAYLFDSKPSKRRRKEREKQGRLLVQTMHDLILCAYGELYVGGISSFSFQYLDDLHLQAEDDGYDCGLFVIKYMQGVRLPQGTSKFHARERPRLLVDLVLDRYNAASTEVGPPLHAYGKMLKARKKQKGR